MLIKYSDIYSRCRCRKFHWLTVPLTLSLERGPFPKQPAASITGNERGQLFLQLFLQFLQLCGAARARSSPGRAAEGTHTLWNSRSAPLASPAPPLSPHCAIPNTFYPNCLGIIGRKLREKNQPHDFFAHNCETSSHTSWGLRDNPVGLNQGTRGANSWRASQQREQDLAIREAKNKKRFLNCLDLRREFF